MNRVIRLLEARPGQFHATIPFLGGGVHLKFEAKDRAQALVTLREKIDEEALGLNQISIVLAPDLGECELDMTFLCSIGGISYFTEWDPAGLVYHLHVQVGPRYDYINPVYGKDSALIMAQRHAKRFSKRFE